MLTWMIYAVVVAGFLAVGGLALERIFDAAGWPRRFAWLAVLTLTVMVPLSATPPNPADRVESRATGNATGASETVPVAATSPRSQGTGESNPARADRSAFLVWSITSLLAFTALCVVIVVSAAARRRWERRRVGTDRVYVSRGFGPALVGFLRPAVVIPRWVLSLDARTLATVVRHEREHARVGDHLLLLYSGLVAVAFPWSPAVWWMCSRLRSAVEIDCDRRVISSGIPAAEYGSLLLGIGAGRPGRQMFALTLADSGSLLERRLKAMSTARKAVRMPGAILLCAMALATVVAACQISAPTEIGQAVEEVLATRPDGPESAATGLPAPEETGTRAKPLARQDGSIVVRGINRSPYFALGAGFVAADPLVLLDGSVVEGGLGTLVTMMDTLDFSFGALMPGPVAAAEYGDRARGGAVIMQTRGSWWRPVAGRLLPALRYPKRSEEPGGRRERATREEGDEGPRVVIQGIGKESARLTLPADIAARNPGAVVDGRVIKGGLSALLTMVDTLEFETVGFFGFPARVVIETKQEVD